MATSAATRGWGSAPSPRINITTLRRANGVVLPVHQTIAELVTLLCDETERRGYELRAGECWGYAPRKIAGSNTWSNHAWGLAVDINAPANPMGARLITDMPDWMPELWKAYGFRWGGDYSGKKDAMHFEFMGTPHDASNYTAVARHMGTGGGGERNLSKGMRGEDVRTWQTILIGAGVLPQGQDDGVFGVKTLAATKAFQRKLGVTADGIVGPATREAVANLFRLLAAQ